MEDDGHMDVEMEAMHAGTRVDIVAADTDGQKHAILNVKERALLVQSLNYYVEIADTSEKKRFCQKQAMKELHVLKDVNLVFNPGTLTAIMGPSGAGKTSLLNSIAGRTYTGRITGTYLVNGKPLDKSFSKYAAYVMQDDILHWHLTPRETLESTARLRLPASMSDADKIARVDELVHQLGLQDCQDTVVGEPGVTKGISGGEKKRLNIAMELLTTPSLLFVDEPTSGLDSHTAGEIMTLLKRLAEDGVTVVATIHQPSSEIYAGFDRLILLSKGQIMYSGKACNAPHYFAERGHPCPPFSNPADFMLTLASGRGRYGNHVDELCRVWAEGNFDKEDIQAGRELAVSMVASQSLQIADEASVQKRSDKLSAWRKLGILTKRSWKSYMRNPIVTKQRVGQSIILALMFGLIFLQVGSDHDQVSIDNRNGVLIFLMINAGFGGVMTVVSAFAQERPVFLREYAAGSYGLTPYFFSRTFVEIPVSVAITLIYCVISYWMVGLEATADRFFLYCIILVMLSLGGGYLGFAVSAGTSNLQAALALAPFTMIPQIMFAGFFLNQDSVPPYFIWLPYITPYKYAWDALVVNEYEGQTFECDASTTTNGECPISTGEDVIRQFGSDRFSKGFSIFMVALLTTVVAGVGIIVLSRQAARVRKAAKEARSAMIEASTNALAQVASQTLSDEVPSPSDDEDSSGNSVVSDQEDEAAVADQSHESVSPRTQSPGRDAEQDGVQHRDVESHGEDDPASVEEEDSHASGDVAPVEDASGSGDAASVEEEDSHASGDVAPVKDASGSGDAASVEEEEDPHASGDAAPVEQEPHSSLEDSLTDVDDSA